MRQLHALIRSWRPQGSRNESTLIQATINDLHRRCTRSVAGRLERLVIHALWSKPPEKLGLLIGELGVGEHTLRVEGGEFRDLFGYVRSSERDGVSLRVAPVSCKKGLGNI